LRQIRPRGSPTGEARARSRPLWNTLRERRAARREERERQAEEDLELITNGEAQDLTSYKRAMRRDCVGEGFPSAGAGVFPAQAGERTLGRGRKGH
jgi:hypothetical protein